MSDDERRPLAVIGMRCVGKTSIGRELARLTGAGFVDLDEEIAAEWSRGPGAGSAAGAGEVLSELGVERFRGLEAQVLEGVLEQAGPGATGLTVIATGGGCVETSSVRDQLDRDAWCVHLREKHERLVERLKRDPQQRPALTRRGLEEEVDELARRRDPLYGMLARVVVDCDGQSVESVARRVLDELPKAWRDAGRGSG
ncbi:MAG: shikimate kinase [Planctomycetota bacterium]